MTELAPQVPALLARQASCMDEHRGWGTRGRVPRIRCNSAAIAPPALLQSKDGAYQRPQYSFQGRIGSPEFPLEPGRHARQAGAPARPCSGRPWCCPPPAWCSPPRLLGSVQSAEVEAITCAGNQRQYGASLQVSPVCGQPLPMVPPRAAGAGGLRARGCRQASANPPALE